MATVSTTISVPLVDLRAQYEPLKGEILDDMHLFQGPQQQAFEREFAQFCGCREAIAVSTGTDALELALRAAGIQAGDEVVTQPNSFIATAEAISSVGAQPVFVDMDPDTATLDPALLEPSITPRTKAIIPVHLYGMPANMPAIMELARRHDLLVIEDACQAHGAKLGDQRVGSLADIACFSFYYSKNLGAYGEAGAVTTNSPTLADRVRLYRDHGSRVRYHHEVIGRNARMDEIQAAILRVKLRYVDRWNQQRRAHARRLSEALADTTLALPSPGGDGVQEVFHLYVVRLPERDALQGFLAERGIATGIHYPVPIHLQPACAELGYAHGSFPVAERWSTQCLSLPMYAELSSDQIEQIVAAIHRFDAMGRRNRYDPGRQVRPVRRISSTVSTSAHDDERGHIHWS